MAEHIKLNRKNYTIMQDGQQIEKEEPKASHV